MTAGIGNANSKGDCVNESPENRTLIHTMTKIASRLIAGARDTQPLPAWISSTLKAQAHVVGFKVVYVRQAGGGVGKASCFST